MLQRLEWEHQRFHHLQEVGHPTNRCPAASQHPGRWGVVPTVQQCITGDHGNPTQSYSGHLNSGTRSAVHSPAVPAVHSPAVLWGTETWDQRGRKGQSPGRVGSTAGCYSSLPTQDSTSSSTTLHTVFMAEFFIAHQWCTNITFLTLILILCTFCKLVFVFTYYSLNHVYNRIPFTN